MAGKPKFTWEFDSTQEVNSARAPYAKSVVIPGFEGDNARAGDWWPVRGVVRGELKKGKDIVSDYQFQEHYKEEDSWAPIKRMLFSGLGIHPNASR